jgi:cytochrome P450
MISVTDLNLPEVDLPGELSGEAYHRRLAELRTEGEFGWLVRTPVFYLVLDRESVEFFLRAKATAFPGRELADLFGITTGRLRESIDAGILNQQGDRHRRLRSLVGSAFSPRAAMRWRPAMRGFLTQLWAAIEPAHDCDFVSAIAKPYPALTLAAVLGAPPADAPKLQQWSHLLASQVDIQALATQVPELERGAVEAYDYVEGLLAERRAEPGADVLTDLLSARDGGDKLTHTECVHLVLSLIAGGIFTTRSQLSHALRLFAAHPDQWQALGRQPALAGRAVDEVLRSEPVAPFAGRICTQPVEHRGVLFPAGTMVAACLERANREQPGGDGFDIVAQRDGQLHTFGAGPHFCLGANLARAELEEALAFLAPRMPALASSGPGILGGIQGLYSVESLPLHWS